MKPVLEVSSISKKFVINHENKTYLTLRDQLTHLFKKRGTEEEFWALKEINFKVELGESLGIIGRNGAGKSTLLKILSRITPPTNGRVVARGRIASLLEVGTGFHLELTGRENIYMNGSILGMSATEIKSKLDEIIDFAGTERFLDTQLKHYSSGMQLRLAFAVAASLEPEILIIDEVLAVGDAEFQRKCLRKMEEVVREGRTLLLVSHNLESVRQMCARGLILDEGRVSLDGHIDDVLGKYQEMLTTISLINLEKRTDRVGTGIVRFKQIYIEDSRGNKISSVFSGQSCNFIFEFENKANEAGDFQLDVGITSDKEEKLTWFSTSLFWSEVKIKAGNNRITLSIADFPFMPGNYNFTIFCKYKSEIADWISNAFRFTVEPGDFYGSGKLNNKDWGPFLVKHTFLVS